MNQVVAKRALSADTIRIAAFNATGSVGEWEIKKETVTIGRVSTNDVCLNDKKVSRNHATIELKPAGLLLRDLGSSNGTWVNGQKVSETFLKDLDVVVISGFRLQISLDRAPSSAPWDDKTALANEAGDSTPAEDSNVIPMRNAKAAVPAAVENATRTEVVSTKAMELEAKKPIPAPARPATNRAPAPAAKPSPARPAVMYVGGKRIVRPSAVTTGEPAETAPATMKVSSNEVAEKKARFTKKEKIGLVVGFLVWGLGWAMLAGGGIMMVVLAPKPHGF